MEVNEMNLGLVRGRVGNMVYYVRNGKQYVRRVTIPGKPPKWTFKERSEKQQASIGRFAIVQAFYATYCKSVSDEIWRIAARIKKKMGANYFNSLNCHCFSGDGNLVDFDNFRFSEGKLLLPRRMQLTRDGAECRVTWEEERDFYTASPGDCLWAGVLYERSALAPLLALEVHGTRGEGTGTFHLDASRGMPAHVYCFFGRPDHSAFSPSQHFCVR